MYRDFFGAPPSGSSMTRPVGGSAGRGGILPPLVPARPGVQVSPTMAAPVGRSLGVGHQSGWEGLASGAPGGSGGYMAGAAAVPGASIFDTPMGSPLIDDSTLEDIADQAVAQLGFPGAEGVAGPDELEDFGSFYRVRDDEWDTLEEEELMIDDEGFGFWSPPRVHPQRSQRRRGYQAMMAHHRESERKRNMPFAKSRYGSQPGVDVPPNYAPAPADPHAGPRPEEGTFVSSMKTGAGLALGFFAVGLSLAVITGAGR